MGAHPHEHEKRIKEKLGVYAFNALQERANDSKRGRQTKREEKSISAHYREQLKILQEKRMRESGRIEFVGYM